MKGLSQRLYSVALSALVGVAMLGIITPSPADEQLYRYQYEVVLGGKRPVSNFYLSWRPSALSDDSGFREADAAFRVPLYSSDRNSHTMFTQLATLMNAGDDEDVSSGGSFGDAVGAAAGVLIYVGVPVIALVNAKKDMDKAISEAAGESIRSIEIPEMPAQQSEPASPKPGS